MSLGTSFDAAIPYEEQVFGHFSDPILNEEMSCAKSLSDLGGRSPKQKQRLEPEAPSSQSINSQSIDNPVFEYILSESVDENSILFSLESIGGLRVKNSTAPSENLIYVARRNFGEGPVIHRDFQAILNGYQLVSISTLELNFFTDTKPKNRTWSLEEFDFFWQKLVASGGLYLYLREKYSVEGLSLSEVLEKTRVPVPSLNSKK